MVDVFIAHRAFLVALLLMLVGALEGCVVPGIHAGVRVQTFGGHDHDRITGEIIPQQFHRETFLRFDVWGIGSPCVNDYGAEVGVERNRYCYRGVAVWDIGERHAHGGSWFSPYLEHVGGESPAYEFFVANGVLVPVELHPGRVPNLPTRPARETRPTAPVHIRVVPR